jgi:hypothetical protein
MALPAHHGPASFASGQEAFVTGFALNVECSDERNRIFFGRRKTVAFRTRLTFISTDVVALLIIYMMTAIAVDGFKMLVMVEFNRRSLMFPEYLMAKKGCIVLRKAEGKTE